MSLWSDPIRWGEQVAKSRLHMYSAFAIHLGMLVFGLWIVFDSTLSNPSSDDITFISFLIKSSMVFFAGLAFPCMYLYCIHRLLKMVKTNDKNEEGVRE